MIRSGSAIPDGDRDTLIEIGVQLPEVEFEASWKDIAEMAVLAEQVGLDSIWVGDHLLYESDAGRRGPWECWSLLAALAAVTKRVRLGPLVAALPFHNPAILAKKAATVDEISGGRLVLGVGSGWNEVEFRAFGVPFDRRVARFAEDLEVVAGLLAGETVTLQGEFVAVEGAELLPRPRREIPIMIGSNGPRMLSIAFRHVTHWNTWFTDFGNDPRRLPDLIADVERAWVAAGRGGEMLTKSAALHVSLEHGSRTRPGEPVFGSDGEIAASITAMASLGIDEVQLILDPITPASVTRAGNIAQAVRGS